MAELGAQGAWAPRHFKRLIHTYTTSMGTSEVMTDQGRAYIKAMGSKEGLHPLAAEWAATHLAKWFGLATFDIALLELGEEDCFPLPKNYRALPGPAFASRAMDGHCWGGAENELRQLVNIDHITRLVIFDTWVRNCDRCPPENAGRLPNYANVFLAQTGVVNRLQLIAMDHTHCFNCARDWTPRMSHIGMWQDTEIYGLFPAFVPFLRRDAAEEAVARLREMDKDTAQAVFPALPPQWQVPAAARDAAVEFTYRRAGFVADNIVGKLPFGLHA